MWSYRTVLEQWIRERRQTLEEFVECAENFASEHSEAGPLGVWNLQRLASGRGAGGKPFGPVRPVTARLLAVPDHDVGDAAVEAGCEWSASGCNL